MSDHAVIVRNQGRVFLGGPPLVRAATGEEIDAETLGGADVHCRRSGVTDYYADDDTQALAFARRAAARLRAAPRAVASSGLAADPGGEWDTDGSELYGIIPQNPRKPYDVREVIARLVDGAWFDEFKALYGTTLVCGFADIHGMTVGIVANNGILFSQSAQKGAHFIELCCREGIPLVFLQNISGFMVGQAAEAGGIAKDGAKLVTAVACAAVPKYTVVIGGSFGAGNYAMCGRAYGPRFLFQWPNARTSVMGGEQAASVLATLRREALERSGQFLSPEEEEKIKAPIRAQFEQQGHPYYASARLWDDGVIDPADTRRVLGLALALTRSEAIAATRFGVFRM
jgi:3-methylcrotonyl-CoA carboxylase beta subunit